MNRAGATMVVAAVMILMFLSMAALAIDYGMVKTTKAEAQRAMDAAALAGASAFITSDPNFSIPDSAVSRAKDIAAEHLVHRFFVDTLTAHGLMNVAVNMGARTVRASYNVPPIALWFARRFGSNTMGLTASATARASQTGNATCVKPVAIPDIWNNVDPGRLEDKNGNGLFDYSDANNNGYWDDGETEPWAWTTGTDVYDSASTGYGSTFRNSMGTGDQVKVKDYGRQMLLTTLSSKDDAVSSMYYSWGDATTVTNADSLAARISGTSCQTANTATPYRAANGAKVTKIQDAWQDVINRDPDARWDNHYNTVTGSTAGSKWAEQSPRVVVVALYDPSKYALGPSGNTIMFNNLAKVWLDERPPCAGKGGGNCKQPITGRFLGFLGGGPSGPNTGSLVWRIALIK